MVNESVPAGSYDPAISIITGIYTGANARNDRTGMRLSMDGKGRKFYNIVSHKIGLLDVRIGELQ